MIELENCQPTVKFLVAQRITETQVFRGDTMRAAPEVLESRKRAPSEAIPGFGRFKEPLGFNDNCGIGVFMATELECVQIAVNVKRAHSHPSLWATPSTYALLVRYGDFAEDDAINEPHFLTQEDFNYLVQDLGLSKSKAELLASILKGRKLQQAPVMVDMTAFLLKYCPNAKLLTSSITFNQAKSTPQQSCVLSLDRNTRSQFPLVLCVECLKLNISVFLEPYNIDTNIIWVWECKDVQYILGHTLHNTSGIWERLFDLNEIALSREKTLICCRNGYDQTSPGRTQKLKGNEIQEDFYQNSFPTTLCVLKEASKSEGYPDNMTPDEILKILDKLSEEEALDSGESDEEEEAIAESDHNTNSEQETAAAAFLFSSTFLGFVSLWLSFSSLILRAASSLSGTTELLVSALVAFAFIDSSFSFSHLTLFCDRYEAYNSRHFFDSSSTFIESDGILSKLSFSSSILIVEFSSAFSSTMESFCIPVRSSSWELWASSVQASWRLLRFRRAIVRLPQTTLPEVRALGESRRSSATSELLVLGSLFSECTEAVAGLCFVGVLVLKGPRFIIITITSNLRRRDTIEGSQVRKKSAHSIAVTWSGGSRTFCQ
ncbi:hypothetical protein C0J52_16563 [Blattella germanica]|nr:hypothetical protein C0J52_16563 [Blattella germanica]